MKKLKLIAAFALLCLFSSCIDIEEKITINKDNSGIYYISFNMDKLSEMIAQTVKKFEGEENEVYKAKIDSIVLFENIIDTAANLSLIEKRLFKNANISFKIDEANNKSKVVMQCPFKNISDLAFIKKHFFEVVNKLDISEKPKSKNDAGSEIHAKENQKLNNPLANYYIFEATSQKIVYGINNKKGLSDFITHEKDQNYIKEIGPLTDYFRYQLIFELPAKIKNVKGKNYIISDDKKKLTFTRNFSDFIESPENLEYTIEY